jgi:response regulator NasT
VAKNVSLLVNAQGEADALLEPALAAAGYGVGLRATADADLCALAQRLRAQLVVCSLTLSTPGIHHNLLRLARMRLCPVIVFICSAGTEQIQEAIEAGISAYVVNGLYAERLPAILELAQARFDNGQYHWQANGGLPGQRRPSPTNPGDGRFPGGTG